MLFLYEESELKRSFQLLNSCYFKHLKREVVRQPGKGRRKPLYAWSTGPVVLVKLGGDLCTAMTVLQPR